MTIIHLIWRIAVLILGFYVLFAGRKALWATLGIIALVGSANLMAVLVIGGDQGRDLIEAQAWWLFGAALLLGILGILIGRTRPDLAASLIGIAAGADLALWLYHIAIHLVTTVANQTQTVALWVGVAVLAVGVLLGLWLVRKSRDEALILITMLVGVQLIQESLGLSKSSSWTAILMAAAALAGVLVQYATLLRERKVDETEIRPTASSLAFFQNLELDQ